MNGGDPILGGGQANPNPGNTQSTPPGPQPAPSATPTTTPSQALPRMPQVPQSPVNTAPTPVNTTESPDSFSSFSTQPSRPIAPPHMSTYGNSFSRPTVGRPSFPAPHPIDQPINPMAPNGIINGSQMPPSTLPSSEQVVFSDAGAYSTESSGKGKKIAIIILLLLLVVGGVVAALFATGVLGGGKSTDAPSQSNGILSTKEEVYGVLWDFNSFHYSSLIESYDLSIGLIPNFTTSDTTPLFPAEFSIDSITQNLTKTIEVYDGISPRLPDELPNSGINLAPAKTAIGNSLQSMRQNMDLIEEFYNAYMKPLSSEPVPATCSKSPSMTELEKGNTKEAAEKYYTLYCNSIDYINNSLKNQEDYEQPLPQSITNSASESAASLNKLLTNVPSAKGDIDKLFKELTR